MAHYTLKTELNKPTLYKEDGEILTPVLYGLSDFPAAASCSAYAQKNIAAFANAGIHLINIDTALHLGWHKHSPFDAEAMLCEVANVLDANPQAKVLIRLHVNPPYWWMRDNPDECVLYRTPEGDIPGLDDGNYDRLIAHDYDNHMRVSLASEKWQSEACEKLATLCQTFAEYEEGQAILGLQIACGLFGEWHKWGKYEDVSRPAVDYFKRFLHEKYKTREALAAAWHQEGVTFDTAAYHPEKFRQADEGLFFDPMHSQDVIDAHECTQMVPSNAILRFCRVVKEHLPHVLTGAFYGYYLNTGGDHLKVERLYESDYVDFICGPFCYLENRHVNAVPMQRGLLESTRLRGKLWLTEMDQNPFGFLPDHGGDVTEHPATISTLRRNVLQPLLAGQGLWYYDHRVVPGLLTAEQAKGRCMAGSIYRKAGWWDHPLMMEEIAKLQKLADAITSKPYVSAADVLIVYDKASHFYRQRGWPQSKDYALHEAVARCGVAYDCIYTDELAVAELSRYKCVIFVNAYMITPARRETYRRLLKDTTTLWLGAEGYCDGSTLSAEHLSKTVGMRLKKIDGATTVSFRSEKISGTDYEAPCFAVCPDKETIVLAHYDTGEVAAAMKGHDIWFALSWPSRAFMDEVLTISGAHKYCDAGDPIMAGAGIVAINCPSGGSRCLALKNGRKLNLSLKPHTTIAFDAETGRRLLS